MNEINLNNNNAYEIKNSTVRERANLVKYVIHNEFHIQDK